MSAGCILLLDELLRGPFFLAVVIGLCGTLYFCIFKSLRFVYGGGGPDGGVRDVAEKVARPDCENPLRQLLSA